MNNEPVVKVTDHGIYLEYPLGLSLKIGTLLYTHPVKELTDEEIEKLWEEGWKHFATDLINYKSFARAILRKASEK